LSTQYPNAVDTYSVHSDNVNEKIPAAVVNNIQDAVVSIENRLGVSGLTALPVTIPTAGEMTVVSNQWYISTGTAWVAMASQATPANPLTNPLTYAL
jgi:hypothetical protein